MDGGGSMGRNFNVLVISNGLSRYPGEFTRPQSLSVVAKSVLIEGSPRINTTSSL